MSLLLVKRDTGGVIGFVRILQVANRNRAGLIESLVIDPVMRRRGLGRYLMEEGEDHVRRCDVIMCNVFTCNRLGYESMHLSTHDQHSFYEGIGYVVSEPVNAVRKCSTKVQRDSETETDSEVCTLKALA